MTDKKKAIAKMPKGVTAGMMVILDDVTGEIHYQSVGITPDREMLIFMDMLPTFAKRAQEYSYYQAQNAYERGKLDGAEEFSAMQPEPSVLDQLILPTGNIITQ